MYLSTILAKQIDNIACRFDGRPLSPTDDFETYFYESGFHLSRLVWREGCCRLWWLHTMRFHGTEWYTLCLSPIRHRHDTSLLSPSFHCYNFFSYLHMSIFKTVCKSCETTSTRVRWPLLYPWLEVSLIPAECPLQSFWKFKKQLTLILGFAPTYTIRHPHPATIFLLLYNLVSFLSMSLFL